MVGTATDCATAVPTVSVLPPECEAGSILTVTADVAGCVATLDAELTGNEPFTYLWNLGGFGTYTATNPVIGLAQASTFARSSLRRSG